MEIVKLHCLGNEYYVVSAGAQPHPLPALAGVLGGQLQMEGVRGLIVLWPGPPGQRYVEVYNPKGVRVTPGACALRCAGYASGLGSWELNTGSGLHRVEVKDQETITWFSPPVYGGEYRIGRYYHGYLLNLGHRYFVTFRQDLYGLNLEAQGEALDRYFGGVDVLFLHQGDEVEMRIWQRGGEVAGSSTGACAAAATLLRLDRWQEPMVICMPGGRVTMSVDARGRFVQQTPVELLETIELEGEYA